MWNAHANPINLSSLVLCENKQRIHSLEKNERKTNKKNIREQKESGEIKACNLIEKSIASIKCSTIAIKIELRMENASTFYVHSTMATENVQEIENASS